MLVTLSGLAKAWPEEWGDARARGTIRYTREIYLICPGWYLRYLYLSGRISYLICPLMGLYLILSYLCPALICDICICYICRICPLVCQSRAPLYPLDGIRAGWVGWGGFPQRRPFTSLQQAVYV